MLPGNRLIILHIFILEMAAYVFPKNRYSEDRPDFPALHNALFIIMCRHLP